MSPGEMSDFELSAAEFRALYDRVKHTSRWGPADRRGALNNISPTQAGRRGRAWAAAVPQGPPASWCRRAGGHASSDGTVTWVRRHLDLLRIGGAVIAAPAVLIFRVNWVTLLIIAVLLALYEFGLHRLRQTEPAA
jgi:hypothetical protein